MVSHMTGFRERLTYANVTATLALFLALGGTSYAVGAFPRNSVGSKQIRANAIGASELKAGAVRSSEIKRRAIRLDDISLGARRSLRGAVGPVGPQGPAGPLGAPLTATVDSLANVRSATASRRATWSAGSGQYDVIFSRDMRNCVATATLGSFTGGPATPNAGQVTAETNDHGVVVRTRNANGAPTDLPFFLMVSC